MKNSIRIPIATMIKFLKDISAGGLIYKVKTINSTTSKVALMFSQEITKFNTHYILTKNLINNKNINLSLEYEILFHTYLGKIFSIFFTKKVENIQNKKDIHYIVKNLPNYRLYMEVQKIMELFYEEEKNKFKIEQLMKKCFILNTLLNDEDEDSESSESTQNDDGDNVSINSVNNVKNN